MRYDAMDEIVFNRAVLDVDMPLAFTGIEQDAKIGSDVIFPKSVVAFESDKVQVRPLLPQSNLVSGFRELENISAGIEESSISSTMSGQLPQASQKAYSVAQATAQAQKLIGAVGKTLGQSIIQYGDLMKDIALNHLTTPEVEQLVGGKLKMKYRKLYITKQKGTKKQGKEIIFDEELIGAEMTDEEKIQAEMEMLEEIGWPKNKNKKMVKVNPERFSNLKFLCKVDVGEMFTKNQEYWQPMLLALRRELLNDPNIDLAKLDETVLYAHLQSEGDEIMKEAQANPMMPSPAGQLPGQQPQSPMINQTLNKATASAVENNII